MAVLLTDDEADAIAKAIRGNTDPSDVTIDVDGRPPSAYASQLEILREAADPTVYVPVDPAHVSSKVSSQATHPAFPSRRMAEMWAVEHLNDRPTLLTATLTDPKDSGTKALTVGGE